MCSKPPVPVQTDLHPLVQKVTSLLGTYAGFGEGIYPTIPNFKYWDETRFEAVPSKPVIQYQQKSYPLTEDGQPNYAKSLHLESGFLTLLLNNTDAAKLNAQLVIAHNSGVSEVAEGELTLDSPLTLRTESRVIGLTSTAKQVTQLQRVYVLNGDKLEVTLNMAAVQQVNQQHLRASLVKTSQ
jgi:hypothetical protein